MYRVMNLWLIQKIYRLYLQQQINILIRLLMQCVQWKVRKIIEAQLFPSSGYISTAHFGCSVSTSNNAAIVGAYGNFGADDRSGSAHIFLFDGPVVYSDTTLFPKDGENYDNFGVSVSISDNTVAIVGADGDDDNGSSSNKGGMNWQNIVCS